MLKFGIKDFTDPRLLKRLTLISLSLCLSLQKCFRQALSKFTLDGTKIPSFGLYFVFMRPSMNQFHGLVWGYCYQG